MNLEILTPEKKLFSDEVYGVQLPGVSGSFEVLDKHAPLVSSLKSGRIKVSNDFSFVRLNKKTSPAAMANRASYENRSPLVVTSRILISFNYFS